MKPVDTNNIDTIANDIAQLTEEREQMNEDKRLNHANMTQLFDFMRPDDPFDTWEPFCFKQSLKVGASRGLPNYYSIEASDATYNLDSPDGRQAWKAAAPEGERLIPEDGQAWAEVFCRCHVAPKLFDYLKREGIIE